MTDSLDEFAEAQRLHSLRRENDRLKLRIKAAEEQLAATLQRLDVLEGVDRLDPRPPKWTTPKRPRSSSAVVVAMLSDTHWDEIVRPEDVAGVNAYDRDIATARTKAWALQLAQLPIIGPSADLEGLVLMLAGDLSCGLIDGLHLVDSADTTLGTLLYWSEQAAAAIKLLADAYGKVHVPVVVGNHGRMTAKPRTNLKARDNTDWHLAHLIRRQLAGDDRVTWQIDEASDAEFELYDQRHLVTHGDQFRGGSGVGGIIPPISRGVYRKQQRQSMLGRSFNHAWLGHFHQELWGPGWTVNGSLKGYDGYAAANNWPAEPPAQVAAYVTPAGIEWRTAIKPEG